LIAGGYGCWLRRGWLRDAAGAIRPAARCGGCDPAGCDAVRANRFEQSGSCDPATRIPADPIYCAKDERKA